MGLNLKPWWLTTTPRALGFSPAVGEVAVGSFPGGTGGEQGTAGAAHKPTAAVLLPSEPGDNRIQSNRAS
jgi:hypothetical protein